MQNENIFKISSWYKIWISSKYHRDAKGEVPSSPRPSLDPLSASLHSCCSNCGEQTQISSKHPCCSEKNTNKYRTCTATTWAWKIQVCSDMKTLLWKIQAFIHCNGLAVQKNTIINALHWSKDVYSIVYTDPSYSRQVEVWQVKDYHQKICNLSSSPFCKTWYWLPNSNDHWSWNLYSDILWCTW